MSDTSIELTEDEFTEVYPLVHNHINPTAGWAFGEESGCLFETYGDELEFVHRQDPRKVWTLVGGDDGELYVVSGLHLVNRMGYFVSSVPLRQGIICQVHIRLENLGVQIPDPSEPPSE